MASERGAMNGNAVASRGSNPADHEDVSIHALQLPGALGAHTSYPTVCRRYLVWPERPHSFQIYHLLPGQTIWMTVTMTLLRGPGSNVYQLSVSLHSG